MEIGTKLGHYEIIDRLGAGGMGEVYRARDTKLKREVALKLLREDLATNPERLARLEREAQMLAAINHPNIATMASPPGPRFVLSSPVLLLSLGTHSACSGPIPRIDLSCGPPGGRE